MVSANLAGSRVQQGKHAYLGGTAADCKDARLLKFTLAVGIPLKLCTGVVFCFCSPIWV